MEITYKQIAVAMQIIAPKVQLITNIKHICPILRGGVVPAAILSRLTGIPLIGTCKVKTREVTKPEVYLSEYLRIHKADVLFVDDIIDSGTTYNLLLAEGIHYFTAPVMRNNIGAKLIIPPHINIVSDAWIDFPWEILDK